MNFFFIFIFDWSIFEVLNFREFFFLLRYHVLTTDVCVLFIRTSWLHGSFFFRAYRVQKQGTSIRCVFFKKTFVWNYGNLLLWQLISFFLVSNTRVNVEGNVLFSSASLSQCCLCLHHRFASLDLFPLIFSPASV